MTLDNWLISRLAAEMNALLNRSRIQSILTSNSGMILSCYRRGHTLALHAVLDSNAPLAAVLEHTLRQKETSAGGWADSVAALLRGCTIDAIHAVPNDRVIFIDASSRSSFGVPSRTRIALELQPRKANALVLRRAHDDAWVIVAAAKQFQAPPTQSLALGSEPALAQARSVRVGSPYALPPARISRMDRTQFLAATRDIEPGDRASLSHLLRESDPTCSPVLAREAVFRAEAGADAGVDAGSLGARLLHAWGAVRDDLTEAQTHVQPLYVYRQSQGHEEVVTCHLIPLKSLELPEARGASLNALCLSELARGATPLNAALRPLQKRLTTMLARSRAEVKALEEARSRAADAGGLRLAGEAIYGNLAGIETGAAQFVTPEGTSIPLDPTVSAKANAAAYFKRYKKASSGLPRIEARLRVLRANQAHWEQLEWELERAAALPAADAAPLILEIATSLQRTGVGSPDQRDAARRRKRSAPGESARQGQERDRKITLSDDAIAYVGRSPRDNERLTFSVAGPNDYWFHTRGVPGAHVIVKTNGRPISERQVEEAAALAAGQSRAAASAKAEVDYTQRKNVRRHSAGRPGLVWYDNFQTVLVAPKSVTEK
ncbi:MAG: Rqc2 family fibronectin-binding protein [Candidatus Eremiobacter antarcticus]|nr:DUF814 domain-containing protein [Candidatus Eremiobacteraeota bacterium]MBC5807694.1 DUF814 domain-containing protein [Candidatus Eremiobacteraeota bacterium]